MSASFGTRNVNVNSNSNSNAMRHGAPDGVTVFGRLEAQCVEAIDRVAEQMLMPRSWVVSQILKEWFERRAGLETPPPGGESWDDSFREILGRHAVNEDRLFERPERPQRQRVPA
jgi:hypothetical protein